MNREQKDFWRIIITTAALVAAMVVTAFLCEGCAYRGGKIVEGTNLAIGMTIPGTEWTINALDYVGGLRVAGNDATQIAVTYDVEEKSSYFGVVTIDRKTKMTSEISPTEPEGPASGDK